MLQSGTFGKANKQLEEIANPQQQLAFEGGVLRGEPTMLLIKGQRYRCQNSACGAEIEVTKDSVEGDFRPRCSCGSEMKKPYSPPVFVNRDADREILAPLFRTKA